MKKTFIKPALEVKAMEAESLLAEGSTLKTGDDISGTETNPIEGTAKLGSVFHQQDILLNI